MAEEEQKSSGKIFDRFLEDAGAAAAKPASDEAQGLPRLRLRLAPPGTKSPITIRRKSVAAPMMEASQLLPEILRQVDEARKAQAQARAKAQTTSTALPMVKASPAPAPKASVAVTATRNSRVAWRYAVVFGRPVNRVWIPRNKEAFLQGAYRALDSNKKVGQAIKAGLGPRTAAWVLLAPALLAFLFFNWMPLLRGLAASFQDLSLHGTSHWVGLSHYNRAFADPQVWATFGHAVLFCVAALVLGFWLPPALAIYINELRFGQGIYRILLFIPFLTPIVPAVVVWRWILDQGYGLFNSMLTALVGSPVHIPWLDHPWLAMLSLVGVFLWKNTGWNALIYLTALKQVPVELYETAEMDGAPLWARIRHVTLPHLSGPLRLLLVMQIIATLQIFTEVYLLTAGGPVNSTEMIATYMYKRSFLYLDVGYAAALGVMLFVALLGLTASRLRTLEKEA